MKKKIFLNNQKLDLRVTENSKIIVVSAGVRQKPGESRLSLVQKNTEIYKCKQSSYLHIYKIY